MGVSMWFRAHVQQTLEHHSPSLVTNLARSRSSLLATMTIGTAHMHFEARSLSTFASASSNERLLLIAYTTTTRSGQTSGFFLSVLRFEFGLMYAPSFLRAEKCMCTRRRLSRLRLAREERIWRLYNLSMCRFMLAAPNELARASLRRSDLGDGVCVFAPLALWKAKLGALSSG